MFTFVLLCIFSAVCFSWMVQLGHSVWWKPRQCAKAFKSQGIHGHPYKLLIGNVMELVKMQKEARLKPMGLSHDIVPRILPFYEDAVQKHGKVCLSWLGPTPQLIINDTEMIKEILSSKFDFQRPNSPPAVKLLRMGLLGLEGEQWFERRKLLSPAFHMEKLKGMLPSFFSSCSELVQRWERSIGDKGSCEVDAFTEFQNLAGDAISRTAFGSNYEEGKRIFRLMKEQVDMFFIANLTLLIPGMRFIPTKSNLRRKLINREVASLLNNMIEKREREMKDGTAKNDDLLGLLLESNQKQYDEHGSKSMTREEVIEECKVFYVAGQETTAVMLTWVVVVLSMHPSWQKKARDEVKQVCGENSPTWESLSQLKIVTMILHEVLRLYPPLSFIARHTYKPVTVGGITIPDGVILALLPIQIHHDRKIWGDDANEFNPERFSKGLSNACKHQLAFFPFSWGPRTCLGQSFTLLEAKMAIALILQHFSFELSPSYIHAPHTTLILQPQYGAPIILRRI